MTFVLGKSVRILSGRGARLLLTECVVHFPRLLVLFQHPRRWVNIVPPLLREAAKVVIVNVALASFVQIVKDEQLVFRAQLDFEVLHAQDKLIEADSVVEVEVKEAIGGAEVLEPLLDPHPHEFQNAFQVHFFLRICDGVTRCLVLHV